MANFDNYRIENPQQIETPRLLVFRKKLENNIQRMGEYLNQTAPGTGFRLLCPHVKTHKSIWVTKKLMNTGIEYFKATPNEVEMLIKAGARHILVAYPLMLPSARRLALLVTMNPKIDFTVQVGHLQHAKILRQAAMEAHIRWKYYFDIDIGMHRTGIQPDEAFALFKQIDGWKELNFFGLHGYDGHVHSADPVQRKKLVQQSMGMVLSCVKIFNDNGGSRLKSRCRWFSKLSS